jgi:lipoprotein-anchoring transpeptidase ErfK/SrfK
MKLQVFFAASALALVMSQAAAQDSHSAKTRHAAAPAATANDATAGPAAQPALDVTIERMPSARRKPARRSTRRTAAQQQQPQPQQPAESENWIGRIFGAPAQETAPALRAQQQSQRYAVARPPSNKLFLGMFYSIIPRETVAFHEDYKPGTIVVRHRERRLYYVLGNGQAIRYAIAVGREGEAWSGTSVVSNKREWPDWRPTPSILARQPDLPRHVEGGPHNPLGARALYLGQTLYRIHGTNEPWMIGEEASSGCIRMTNEDVIDLYNRTRMGATVVVQQ